MPLFGHKNKNANTNDTGTARDRSDPLASDYAATSRGTGNTSGGAQAGSTDHSWDKNIVSEINDPTTNASATNDRYGGAGTGFDTSNRAGVGQHSSAQQTQGAQGHHILGGGGVGSAALREQAMLRDREAQNIKAQSQELAEAERLEQKAREHRERAVAQGAHPVNKHLGGQPPADKLDQSHTTGRNY